MTNVILLSHDFQFLNVVSTKKAIKLICKKRVEVIKSSDKEIYSGFFMPKVIRLINEIKASFNKKVPFSKSSVFVRDSYTCQYCGKHLSNKNATIDHVIPVSKGGKNSYTNCVTSCKTCNNWKSDKLLSQTNMVLVKHPTHPTFAEFMYFKMKALGIDLKEIWAVDK